MPPAAREQSDTGRLRVLSRSPAQTRELGVRLGMMMQRGDVVALVGPLGAGKTTLVQGIAEGLGFGGRVRSPSFTLVNEYPTPRGNLYHLDLFRLDCARQAEEAGLDEFLPGDGMAVVEWAERAVDLLPPEHLEIALEMGSEEEERVLVLVARGKRYHDLLELLAGGLAGEPARASPGVPAVAARAPKPPPAGNGESDPC